MRLLAIGMLMLTVAGCGGPDSAAETTAPSEPSTTDRTLPEKPLPNPVAPEEDPSPVTGEVPVDLIEAILADAIDRTGVSAGDFVEARSEQVVWNDGSLGCGEPGQLYTQALVEGYWVVLESGETRLDYRATADGSFRLCEQASSGI